MGYKQERKQIFPYLQIIRQKLLQGKGTYKRQMKRGQRPGSARSCKQAGCSCGEICLEDTVKGGNGMLLEPSIHKALAPHPRRLTSDRGSCLLSPWAAGFPLQVTNGEQLPCYTAGSCWPSILPTILLVLLIAEKMLQTLTHAHSPCQHLPEEPQSADC